MLKNGWVRLTIAVLIASGVAGGATLLGEQVRSPSIVDCGGDCSSYETEYESLGWPIPWKMDAPHDVVESHLSLRINGTPPLGLGISPNGVSRFALGMNVGLWLVATLGTLIMADALFTKRWKHVGVRGQVIFGVVIALGIAAVLTILGTLVTSPAIYNGRMPLESAGWPIEWRTSPWVNVRVEGPKFYEGLRELARPSNMLGYSPKYLVSTLIFWSGLIAFAEFGLYYFLSLYQVARGRNPSQQRSQDDVAVT